MNKFYIVSEEEIYSMHGYADQREWDEPEIFRKEVLNPAYEVEFDGNLREFVKEKIESDKNVHDLMNKLAATPDEVRNVLGKRALIHPIDDAREELDIVHCPDCKYRVKTKDGKYNPDDIVCSYWHSDGLESEDFCSYGERGEYEWNDCEMHETYGQWITKNDKDHPLECSECGYTVSENGCFGRYCPMCGVKMVNFKELEEKK